MNLFFKKSLFERDFKLDNTELLFKNIVSFNYRNIYDDNYVVQGFTISRDYALVTAYNKFHAKSRVYLYEKTGQFKKYIELDNNNHVGGICYDYLNDIIYITGAYGKINAYSYPELICGNVVKIDNDIDISLVIDKITSAATVYFYNNRLYVCTFEGIGKMVIFDLVFSKNKIKVINYKLVDNLPAAIQGICVFKYSNKLYYIFSQSYSKLNSVIKLFDENMKFLGQKKLKEIGIEGIDIDYTGNVCGVFENGVDKIKKIHVSEILSKFNYSLEKKYYGKGLAFQEKMSNHK